MIILKLATMITFKLSMKESQRCTRRKKNRLNLNPRKRKRKNHPLKR